MHKRISISPSGKKKNLGEQNIYQVPGAREGKATRKEKRGREGGRGDSE